VIALLACGAGVASAQESPATQAAHGVTVIKYDWSKERIDWEKDPFGATVEGYNDMRRRVSVERRVEAVKKTGEVGEINKIEQAARNERAAKARPPKPPRYAFLYKVSVKNDGGKEISAIDWDYVFTDAATGEELGRRRFTSAEEIAPGKRKELSQLVSSPPTMKISAYAFGKRERDGLNEQIQIVRVTYEDGTVWQKH
jgi:hypothetical protein